MFRTPGSEPFLVTSSFHEGRTGLEGGIVDFLQAFGQAYFLQGDASEIVQVAAILHHDIRGLLVGRNRFLLIVGIEWFVFFSLDVQDSEVCDRAAPLNGDLAVQQILIGVLFRTHDRSSVIFHLAGTTLVDDQNAPSISLALTYFVPSWSVHRLTSTVFHPSSAGAV